MTRLDRPVTRVLHDVPNRGVIVVTLTKDGIAFRYPRKRTSYLLPYSLGMLRAEYLAAEALRAAKKAAPRTRKVSRSLTRGR